MIACKEYAAPNYLLNTGYKFLVQRPQDPDEAGITLQSDVRIYCAADWKHFQELIQRGSNLWPDAPPEIKEFADLVTNGKVMQDYYRQAGGATDQLNQQEQPK